MKSASFYAAYLVKKMWTLAALLLVIFALLISLLRVSLPYMDGQKAQVESWLSDQYGVELKIGSLSADWSKAGPSLVLNNIQLKQDKSSPIGLQIERTEIELDFWASLLARQIQSQRFDLSGLSLDVNLARIQMSETQFPIVEALESLFLEQLHRFSVTDSLVAVTNRFDTQLIQVQALSWVNKEFRHQGVGQFRIVELANNSATFTLDLYGGKNDLNGSFYASGEEIDLSPWLNQFIRSHNQLTESRANFEIWAGIDNGIIDSAQIQLNQSEFAWKTPQNEVKASILGGNIRGIPDAKGWKLNIEDLTLASQGQNLVTSWSGHIGKDGISRFNSVSSVNVEALLPVLPLVFEPTTMQFINRLSPTARVDHLALQLGNQFAATAEFSGLGWQQVDGLPGIANLTGSFAFIDEQGLLKVNGVAGQLQVNNTLDNNFNYQNLQLAAHLQWKERGVELYIPEIRFQSDGLNLNQSLAYDSMTNQLSVTAQIEPLSINQVKGLFPKHYMGDETREYLLEALIAGKMQNARLLWQGDASQFPFEEKQGVFQAQVELQNVTMAFDPQWPHLEGLDIDLLFENDGLQMRADKGQLVGVSLQHLEAQIDHFTDQAQLHINTTATATAKQVSELLSSTFLAESVGALLQEQVIISDTIGTDLELHIPLSGQNTKVSGLVNLAGNQVYIRPVEMTLDNAQGVIEFVNDVVTVNHLQAELLGQPVTLDYAGRVDDRERYISDITLAGDWRVTPLLETYHPAMQRFVSGTAKWSTSTHLVLDGKQYQYEAELLSHLDDISSSLPAPFNKQSKQSVPLKIVSKGDSQASTVNLTMGDDIRFNGVLPHDTMEFSRAHLAIGDDETLSMGLGFSIFANLQQADFDAWFEVISALVEDLPKSDNPLLGEPQRIHVNAANMIVAGQNINQLELVAKHSTDDWLLSFNADQIRAQMTFYSDWLGRGIDVKADFIDFAQWQEDQSGELSQSTLKNLPPINFMCKQCRILGRDLGRIDFSLSRAATGMAIDQIRINNNNGILYASGDWFIDELGSSTRLKGELSSPDFGALLKGLGLDSGIKDSKAKFDFDLSWRDSPHKFSVASLNGGVDWRLTDGYLSDVSDKGARLFSILSLQSLVRKLSLDFRDVFAKGFFYDKMKGSFQLSDGRADTQDTVIDGAAGEMTLAGYTNLTSKELNYQIEFTPNVTSSLPLLVYWMVNPATAVAALALDKVLTEAKVISSVRYSVTGTLEEPVMTELDRKSKDVQLPARVDPDVGRAVEPQEPPAVLDDERVSLGIIDG